MATKTFLTGLKSHPNGRNILIKLYDKILRLAQNLPKEAAYRKHTERIVCQRLSIANSTEDVDEIEKAIGSGPLPMLIIQARAEYELCEKMLVWKPWENLADKAPPGQWQWPHCRQ